MRAKGLLRKPDVGKPVSTSPDVPNTNSTGQGGSRVNTNPFLPVARGEGVQVAIGPTVSLNSTTAGLDEEMNDDYLLKLSHKEESEVCTVNQIEFDCI